MKIPPDGATVTAASPLSTDDGCHRTNTNRQRTTPASSLGKLLRSRGHRAVDEQILRRRPVLSYQLPIPPLSCRTHHYASGPQGSPDGGGIKHRTSCPTA